MQPDGVQKRESAEANGSDSARGGWKTTDWHALPMQANTKFFNQQKEVGP